MLNDCVLYHCFRGCIGSCNFYNLLTQFASWAPENEDFGSKQWRLRLTTGLLKHSFLHQSFVASTRYTEFPFRVRAFGLDSVQFSVIKAALNDIAYVSQVTWHQRH